MRYIIICLVCSFQFCLAQAGKPNLYSFEKSNVVALIENGDTLRLAWAGGMNEPLLNTIDLDMDGTDDLLLFDKSNHTYQTYLARGQGGNRHYQYAPQYEAFFPAFDINATWALTRDFNCDGKKDLFFNSNGDIYVWENTSTTSLSFTPANNGQRLETKDPTPLNLHVSSVSLPGIVDVDNDNALDILMYPATGNEMHYHKGQTPCGLDFALHERCWGHFTESGTSQGAALHACIPYTKKKTMHSGSSLLPIDLNGDQVKDLIFGGVGFNHLFALYNGGTLDSAHMVSQSLNYPASHPVHILSFPGMTYEDVTFDHVPDLLVSPRQGGNDMQNVKSLHLYENLGTASTPNFSFVKDDFLQDEMVDVGYRSVPRLADLNGDSLPDLVVSNFNRTTGDSSSTHRYTYYKNTGTTTAPEFTLDDANFMNISSHGITHGSVPTFGDLDGDGDLDALVGQMDGSIAYFENQSATHPTFTMANSSLLTVAPRQHAAPFLYDLDSNGTLDLIIGTNKGTLYYYNNSSTTQPLFTWQSGQFGGINVPPTEGFSSPYLVHHNGYDNLFIGTYSSGILQYDSLQSVSHAPPVLQPIIGSGQVPSTTTAHTPFGIKHKNGRNQILIRAAEMKNAGLVPGYIEGISFKATSAPNNLIQRLSIQLKHTDDTVAQHFDSGFEPAIIGKPIALLHGWNYIEFEYPFLWDGGRNILIEICFKGQQKSPDIHVEMSDVGYPANAYGNYDDPTLMANGCAQTYNNSTHYRPNMRILLKPTFAHTATHMAGMHTAPAVADLDNDGYLDMIVGNMNGGLTYYKGKVYDVGIQEPKYKGSTHLNVYPNPGTGQYVVHTPYTGNATLQVYSLSGKQVLQVPVYNEKTTVDLSRQPSGMYIFIYAHGDKLKTAKVIQQ